MLKPSSLQQFDFTKWIQKEILIRICGTKVPLLAYVCLSRNHSDHIKTRTLRSTKKENGKDHDFKDMRIRKVLNRFTG